MRLMRALLTALLIVVPMSCLAKLKISSSYDPKAPFASMKAYSWGVHEMQDPATINFDEEFVQTRVHDAVNQGLAAKGFRQQREKADFVIHWSVLVGTAIAVTRSQRGSDPALGGIQSSVALEPPSAGQIQDVDVGTLILTFVDARTQKVVWRGFAQEAFNFNWSDRKKTNKINNAVSKLLDLFPPAPGGTGQVGFGGK